MWHLNNNPFKSLSYCGWWKTMISHKSVFTRLCFSSQPNTTRLVFHYSHSFLNSKFCSSEHYINVPLKFSLVKGVIPLVWDMINCTLGKLRLKNLQIFQSYSASWVSGIPSLERNVLYIFLFSSIFLRNGVIWIRENSKGETGHSVWVRMGGS